MRRIVRAFAVLAVVSIAAARHPSRASCGSASCFLVTHSDQGVAAAGVFQIDLSFRFVDQSRKLHGSRSVSDVLVPKIDFENGAIEPDHHREIRTENTTLQLGVAYGIMSRWSVFGEIPLLVDKRHEHFDDAGTPDETFTTADGTRGFGDVRAGVRYGFLVRPKDLLIGSAAVKLPTGAYALHDSGGAINEPTIQPGSGSYDAIASVHYVRHAFPSAIEGFVAGTYKLNRENRLRYRIGDEIVLAGGIDYDPASRWVASFQIDARRAWRDRFFGERVPSTGSRSITLTPGGRFRATDRAEIYAYLQIPVYQRVNEAQLAPRAGFVFGFTRSF